MAGTTKASEAWPRLDYEQDHATYDTLHMWTQIVGKVRLMRTPWRNHAWQVALYLTARGLTTSPIPHGRRSFSMDFDFVDHQLIVQTSDGETRRLPLRPQTVADFYAAVMRTLDELGVPVRIRERPEEVMEAIPFSQDTVHATYEADAAYRLWQAWRNADRVFQQFQTGYLGKTSPVHFFWGSFDLAATRFSGRPAPLHPGGIPNFSDRIAQEAYSHEVSSAGFWSGGDRFPEPIFYAYAYPTPDGFAEAQVAPEAARFEASLGEFILPYEDVRTADDPDGALLRFLQSTYDATADLAAWDRAALDCALGEPDVPRPLT